MSGYYTQQRKLPLIDLTVRYTYGNGQSGVIPRVASYSQVTTSYRSEPLENSTQTNEQILASPPDRRQVLASSNGCIPMSDTGHEFYTIKGIATGNNFPNYKTYSSDGTMTQHPLVLNAFAQDCLNPPFQPSVLENSLKNQLGNKAVKETVPNDSVADLSNFFGEFMRDGLPSVMFLSFTHIMKDKTDFFKNLGSEYLNVVFGWTPFIRDLEKLLRAVSQANKLTAQYVRDSGRQVRRSYKFPESNVGYTVRSVQNDQFAYYAPFSSDLRQYGTECSVSITQNRFERIYFKGSYTYVLPSDKNLAGKIERYASLADHLLGLRLTPEVLWNLAPWSWLSDWIVNVGDNISVASAFQKDNLVINYGYLMRTHAIKQAYNSSSGIGHLSSNKGKVVFPPLAHTLKIISKERFRASPYGFGVNPNTLSVNQWAILGALAVNGAKNPEPLRLKR